MSLGHALVVCDLTQILTGPHLQPDPSTSIWVKLQTTNAWSRPVEATWKVGIRFKISPQSKLKLYYHSGCDRNEQQTSVEMPPLCRKFARTHPAQLKGAIDGLVMS